MHCPEGLIYDKNLLSCAIPGDDWECLLGDDEDDDQMEDENNVYGIENLDVLQDQEEAGDEDEFLEVIDEDLNLPESRSDDGSGGGGFERFVTPSTSTVSMITTQLQRLTQLMQHAQDEKNGVIDDEMTADDLNSFLATQKVQSASPEYQQTDFHSDEKTPVPSNGRIHPDIVSDILLKQNHMNSQANRLTTIAMDATTQRIPLIRPISYVKKDPVTEIQLTSGQSLDGTGSHQIVVNRPEGSVMFNVPPNDRNAPYLSEDILKTILEISKQMVTQNHQKQTPQVSYAPQPFYYGVPVPILSPQNNVQSFYQDYNKKNLTQEAKPEINTKTRPNNVQIISTKSHANLGEKSENALSGYFDNFGNFHQQPKPQRYDYETPLKPYQNPLKTYQNPNYFYQSNPYGGYQNSQYSPYSNYQFPAQNQYPINKQQQYNFDGAYYENRPFVIESSAPYVEHSREPKPFGKESYATSYDNHDDDDNSMDENLYDDGEVEQKSEKDQLICSFVVQRQANKTDCSRYYVCNAKNKEVLSYTCPLFTAFNDQTKYCDAQSLASCQKIKEKQSSLSQNQRIYNEAHKALQAVKKESQKVERIASLVKKESQKLNLRRNQFEDQLKTNRNQYNTNQYDQQLQGQYHQQQNNFETQPSAFEQSFNSPVFEQTESVQKPLRRKETTAGSIINHQQKPKQSQKKKKKKVRCRDVGNMVDPASSQSYWHCFKVR